MKINVNQSSNISSLILKDHHASSPPTPLSPTSATNVLISSQIQGQVFYTIWWSKEVPPSPHLGCWGRDIAQGLLRADPC
jgi:hypothetical protein